MKYFVSLLSVALFIACQSPATTEHNQEKTEAPSVQDTVMQTDKPGNDLQSFWNEFRNAALALDSAKIIAMTKFPFQTRATMDSDPVIEYNQKKFWPMFRAFLEQSAGIDEEGSTEADIIRKIVAVDPKETGENYIRIGDMVFEREAGQSWKMSFAYLNYETEELLSK